jgi:cyclophilin family peptidyl-prolyl cis-trans isomerase
MFGETLILTAGDVDGIRVRCDVSTNSRETWEGLDVLVKPYWSHGGASRFLDLVRSGHYDGSAFHRAVPSLVTQFGIARDHAVRTRERSIAVRDDHDRGRVIKFEPGYLSFAGSGADSRSTEVFVVNPGVGEAELGRFGDNSWETPFGHLIGDVDDGPLTRIYSGYGDMFPFGNGESFRRRRRALSGGSELRFGSSLSYCSPFDRIRSGSQQNLRRRWIHRIQSSGIP